MNKLVIAVLIAACFVATSTAAKDKEEPKSNDINVPLLVKGKSVLIKGENNNILANEDVLYKDEKHFKKGDLYVKLRRDHGIYVNDKLVLKQDKSDLIIKKNPKLKAKNIDQFEIRIDEQGKVTIVLKTFV